MKSTSLITTSDGALFVNGCTISAVLDDDDNVWFNGKSVAKALNKFNTSHALSSKVAKSSRKPLKTIRAVVHSPNFQADPRNIFVDVSGLISLANVTNSCDLKQINSFIVELLRMKRTEHNNDLVPRFSELDLIQGRSKLVTINGRIIPFVVENGIGWFQLLEVTEALGYPYDIISRVVPAEHTRLSESSLEINQIGISAIIAIKIQNLVCATVRRNLPNSKCDRPVERPLKFHCYDASLTPMNLSAMVDGDALIINDITVRCVVDVNGVSWFFGVDLAAVFDFSDLNAMISKCVKPCNKAKLKSISFGGISAFKADGRFLVVNLNGLMSIFCSRWNLKGRKTSLFSRASLKTSSSGGIVVKKLFEKSRLLYAVSGVNDINSMGTKYIWHFEVPGHKKVLGLIELFLSPWQVRKRTFNIDWPLLSILLATICQNFNSTMKFISQIDPLADPALPLVELSPNDIRRLASQADVTKGNEWIYVASSKSYAASNTFKVGSTTRLARRIVDYQTGRLQKDFFHYYKVRQVFHSKKIDSMINFFLEKWSQKVSRWTEMYILNFTSLALALDKIIDLFEDSRQIVVSHVEHV